MRAFFAIGGKIYEKNHKELLYEVARVTKKVNDQIPNLPDTHCPVFSN